MDLQELITRGRYLFSSAPARLEVFKQVNGKRTAKEMAAKLGRHVNNVRSDLKRIEDTGLIKVRIDQDSKPIKRNGFPLYEKDPLARTISLKYFQAVGLRPQTAPLPGVSKTKIKNRRRTSKQQPLPLPSEQEILDICKSGEDQIHEFKGQGAEIRNITKEISGMLNTRQGGMILYGVGDDGTIQGSDLSRQKFDQSLYNSLHSNIEPAATVKLHERKVLHNAILVIIVPPWNKKQVYFYNNRAYIRKGTSVLPAKPDENMKLHHGEYVV